MLSTYCAPVPLTTVWAILLLAAVVGVAVPVFAAWFTRVHPGAARVAAVVSGLAAVAIGLRLATAECVDPSVSTFAATVVAHGAGLWVGMALVARVDQIRVASVSAQVAYARSHVQPAQTAQTHVQPAQAYVQPATPRPTAEPSSPAYVRPAVLLDLVAECLTASAAAHGHQIGEIELARLLRVMPTEILGQVSPVGVTEWVHETVATILNAEAIRLAVRPIATAARVRALVA